MTDEELNTIYWPQFRLMEKRVIATFSYVECSEYNLCTYSKTYAYLLTQIGSAIDKMISKNYLGNDVPVSDARKFIEYFRIQDPHVMDQKVYLENQFIELRAFRNLLTSAPEEVLVWWKPFRRLQLDKQKYLMEATLWNVLDALGTLWVLLMREYYRNAKKNPAAGYVIPDDPSELFNVMREAS